MSITEIHIQQFKSIKDSDAIHLNGLNVLIGANGVGKSNFVDFFNLLGKIFHLQLQHYLPKNSTAERLMYFSPEGAGFLSGDITFDDALCSHYHFKLKPNGRQLLFEEEALGNNSSLAIRGEKGSLESRIFSDEKAIAHLAGYVHALKVYHFDELHAWMNESQWCDIHDYLYLREDASNLAAFLYHIQQEDVAHLQMMERMIQSISPFFSSFYLQPDEQHPQKIALRWKEHHSDELFEAFHLSEGTLRMICLFALLMQPDLPPIVIIDEPELGLHPFALGKLAELLKIVSEQTQVLISTQAPGLIDEFQPEDILVVDRKDKQSVFSRLNSEHLKGWLDKGYSLSELWMKNLLGGRP